MSPLRLRAALSAVAAVGLAAGGLALAAPLASAQEGDYVQVRCSKTHTLDDYLAGQCTGPRPADPKPSSPFTPPTLGLFEIPDQPDQVARALIGAATAANRVLPNSPFVYADVAGPTSVVGWDWDDQIEFQVECHPLHHTEEEARNGGCTNWGTGIFFRNWPK